jgi:Ser/Thr protein kinase RdoA (MazF antagonist)
MFVQLIAEGRMAEVFAFEDGRVVKLDRPEWDGVSAFESDVITRAAKAGLPVARSYGVVTIDGRCGVVLDRVEGESLGWVVREAAGAVVDDLAKHFAILQASINATTIGDLPDLVSRLQGEIGQSGLPGTLRSELADLLSNLDDGQRGVCHFDFHPANVLVSPNGWIVIDWLTAASGPPAADLARTLLLWGDIDDPPIVEFMRGVRRHSHEQRSLNNDTCDAWIRVVAGARLAEGFGGDYAAWLGGVADGSVCLRP